MRAPAFTRSLFGNEREDAPAPDEAGQALVLRWRRGDRTAFADIFKAYRSLVYGVLHHLLSRDPEIEDVVQQAFIEVFRSLESFEGRSKLSSWIARIALHVGYRHLRRRKSRPADYNVERVMPDLIDDSPHVDPEVTLARRETLTRIYAILETIAPRKRSVFILNDLEAMAQEEVADVVGTSIATVRTRLFYARKEFWKKASRDPVLAKLGFDAGTLARPNSAEGTIEVSGGELA